MNKHILLVMKWLNDKDSVTQEELNDNRKAADADETAYDAATARTARTLSASFAAASAAAYASFAAAYADNAVYAEKWINKYFERSCENKQNYIDELNKDSKMKTVIDAVNEWKGKVSDLPSVCATASGRIVFTNKRLDDDYYTNICTREEYVNCVNMLSGCALELVRWKKSKHDKPTLTPLETPLDDNSVQYKISNIGNVLHNISCSTHDEDKQNELGMYASFLWELSKDYGAKAIGKTENSKPEYTQAMCDAGIAPSVGMEFMWTPRASEDLKLCVMLGRAADECWIEFDGKTTIVGNIAGYKPLTPPVELIDGEAYRFEYNGFDRLGFYCEHSGDFRVNATVWSEKDCTNIKHLTVKGEE